MEELKYNTNWNNKLDCPIHSTIRLHNNKKYQVGKQFKETLKGIEKNIVEVVEIRTGTLKIIPSYVFRQDTGLTEKETIDMIRTMYKNFLINENPIDFETQQFDVIYLKIVKKCQQP